MHRIVESAKRRWYAAGATAAGVGLVAPTSAMAAQDYEALGTGAASEVSAAIPIGLGILVLTLGIPIAIRILKRVAS